MTEEQQQQAGAFHEAGHAWAAYWHFLRKGWADGIEITMEPPDFVFGIVWCRGQRVPDAMTWPWYAEHSAAGSVAEGLYLESIGRESWEAWRQRARTDLEGMWPEYTNWPDEYEDEGDAPDWVSLGLRYEQPVDFATYWAGWKRAAELLRRDWKDVQRLTDALRGQRKLSPDEVLTLCDPDGRSGGDT
jgi:hypothetical protein